MIKTLYESLLFVACLCLGFAGGLYATKLISGTAVVMQSGAASDTSDSGTDATDVADIKDETPKCLDGTLPDKNGCCAGETSKFVEGTEDACPPDGYCCCPDGGGDCFPPIRK